MIHVLVLMMVRTHYAIVMVGNHYAFVMVGIYYAVTSHEGGKCKNFYIRLESLYLK